MVYYEDAPLGHVPDYEIRSKYTEPSKAYMKIFSTKNIELFPHWFLGNSGFWDNNDVFDIFKNVEQQNRVVHHKMGEKVEKYQSEIL